MALCRGADFSCIAARRCVLPGDGSGARSVAKAAMRGSSPRRGACSEAPCTGAAPVKGTVHGQKNGSAGLLVGRRGAPRSLDRPAIAGPPGRPSARSIGRPPGRRPGRSIACRAAARSIGRPPPAGRSVECSIARPQPGSIDRPPPGCPSPFCPLLFNVAGGEPGTLPSPAATLKRGRGRGVPSIRTGDRLTDRPTDPPTDRPIAVPSEDEAGASVFFGHLPSLLTGAAP